MSRRAPVTGGRNKRGRRKTLLWIIVMTAIVVGLLYYEKIALLYVLATLGVTVLLVLVAVANLGGSKKMAAEVVAPVPPDDAAAIGSGINSTFPSGTASRATSTPRAGKRR
jgi:hypothetical protein